MGTMLAQKKPLESIQRSQAINFVAEIFYDELQFILDRRLLDHTMVNCHGMNSRVKSRDVLSVSVQHIAATNADKEYILLNLARNSIYHQLPELLFHPLVLSTPGMSNKEIAEHLCISVNTVITHRRNIARKLQIHSPAGLTIYAIVNNLIDISAVKL